MQDIVSRILDGAFMLMHDALQGSVGAIVQLVVQIWILYILLQASYMLWRLMHKIWIPKTAPPVPPAHPNGQRVLMVGDSTARGTGAHKTEETIAGRLRKDFPNVEIINNSVDGATTSQVLAQLQATSGQKFDLVFVATGGNDIWRFSSSNKLRADLTSLLTEAIAISNHRVIVLFYANFGSAPIFPDWIIWLLHRRTERVHAVFSDVCGALKVPCIELYTQFADEFADPNYFSKDPKRYYAKDYTHPSGDGYGLWYRRIWREMGESGFISGLKS